MPQCTHCLINFNEREAVFLPEDKSKVFCCNGCRGIWQFIHNQGLEKFYAQRQWQQGGIPEGLESDIELVEFETSIVSKDGYSEIHLYIDGIRCASCVWLNEKVLQQLKGIQYVRINYGSYKAVIRWTSAQLNLKEILKTIQSIGYKPKPYTESVQLQAVEAEAKDLLIRFASAGFLSSQLMIYSIALYAGYFQGIEYHLKLVFEIIAMVLTLPVLFYSGAPFFKAFWSGLKQFHFGMDSLIAIGASSAFIYSVYQIFAGGKVYFDTAAMIITLILLGRYIEAIAKGKASQTIQRLAEMLPKEVSKLMQDGSICKTAVSQLNIGEKILIKPGERVPIDGTVIDGISEVDESIISGESKPVTKGIGSKVIAATVNKYGALTVLVDKLPSEFVMSAVIKAVREAQDSKPKIQAFADKVVSVFVPAIILIAFITAIVRLYLGETAQLSLMTAVSVLVIACPCSLGLATPLAILIYSSMSSMKGILLKNADVAEKAAVVDYSIFDKTGTITYGRQRLVHWELLHKRFSKDDVMLWAASLESLSEHTIGRAIADAYNGRVLEVLDFKVIVGKGVKGSVNAKQISIGSKQFMIDNDVSTDTLKQAETHVQQNEASGQTVVFMSVDNILTAIFIIADTVRKEAKEAISKLKRQGFKTVLLSGDNYLTCKYVAQDVGFDDFLSQQSPMMKAEYIKKLKSQGYKPMMIGDGINDAPCITEAYLGIAMGKGTDIAMQSADATLIRQDLMVLPEFVSLSRKTKTIIRENIFWAFFYNIAAVPMAIAGILHPIVAAAAMAASSLFVAFNSLRIRNL